MKGAKTPIALLAALAVPLLTACDAESQKPAAEPAPVSRPAVTVTDSLGRRMAVPDPVRRIACLYAFTGHVVAMLGKQENIVAVSNGLKRDVLLNMLYPAMGQARVPKAQGALNVEELVNARPDLALISGDIGRREGERSKLDRFRIPYLVIEFTTVAEQQQAITAIGKAIGAEAEAIEYNRYYDEVLERLAARTTALGKKMAVRLYQATTDPTRTVAGKSLPVQWMRRIGIENLATGIPLGRENRVGMEQLLLWDPDVILANEPGVVEAMRDNPQWASLQALRENRIYQMPIGISRWGHPGSLETPLGALWTARAVYPELFSDLDLPRETREFYRRFFRYRLSDEMVSRVLKGEDMRLGKDHRPLPRATGSGTSSTARGESPGRRVRGDGSGRRQADRESSPR